MSKLVNAGQATLPTGSGGVVINVGFVPKAIVVLLTGQTTGSNRIATQSAGVIAGATVRSRAGAGRMSNANIDARFYLSESRIATVWPVDTVIGTQVAISASIAGTELTLTPASSLDTAYTITWMAFGGDGVDVALRSTVFANATTTTVDDCGFDPTCVILGSGDNGTLDTLGTNRAELALGAVVASTQRAAGFAFQQAADATAANSRWMTNRAANTYTGGVWQAGTLAVSLVTGGFSINNNTLRSGWAWALCIRGLDVALLSSQLATSAVDVDLTGAGFTPNSALAFGLPDNTNNDTNQNATTSAVWGVAIRDGNQASASVIGGYDTNRTGAVRASASAGLVTIAKTGVNTYADQATATATFLADGIRYTFTTGHAAEGRFGVLLFDGPDTGPTAPGFRSYYAAF